jgi:hypothetical protein
MTDFVVGKSVWKDGEVTRVRDSEEMPVSAIGIDKNTNSPSKVKQFLACVVYNYDSEQFEIFETDKATIIKSLWEYDQDPDYGDAQTYDVKVGKTGSGMKTKYSCVAAPPKPVSKEIKDQQELSYEDLDKMMFSSLETEGVVVEDPNF